MDDFVEFLDRKSKEKTDYDNISDIIKASNAHFFHQCLYNKNYTGISTDHNYLYNNELVSLIDNRKELRKRKMSNYDEWQNEHLVETIHTDKELKVIDVSASSLKDLIDIINNNPYDSNFRYNIDLRSLHIIKDNLVGIDSLIGMKELKTSIFNQLLYFLQRLHISNNNKEHDFKHTVIYGSPGTGKTEIAKLIGSMYSKLGLLKNNVFRKVTRDDLIAGYLGQTAIKVKKVIDECGCIFIDEVYSLSNGPNDVDSFSKECIDTICEALSDRKKDLMVIIAGYEKEVERNFFNINPGLKSRFIWNFKIDKYDANELFHIFHKKLLDSDWSVLNDNDINLKWFEKNYNIFKHFGRDIEVLFSYIKICHSKRMFGNTKPENLKKITLDDLNNGLKSFKKNMIKDENPLPNIPGLYV
jgi:SpoVK/Ycf46/Vps4 family AAA+-type ATPase